MEILFQDSSIIAINKPSGLLTIQDGYHPEFENAKSNLDAIFGKVWTVHRLDKDTSGIVIFALTPSAHKILCIQFADRFVKKEYIALVYGVIVENELTVDLPLRINGDRMHRTVVDQINGKPASTFLEVTQVQEKSTRIRVFPKTGYTHQIRCHLAAIGHPVLGDNLYQKGVGGESLEFPRLALHAHQITFRHPKNQSLMTLTAPIPDLFLN